MDKNKNITTQKKENIDSKSKKEDKEKELEKEEPVIILQAQTLQEKLYYLRSSYDLARAGVTMPTEFLNRIYEDLLKQIHIARKLRLDGIVLFDWAHLNNSYQDVLKASAFKAVN